MDNIFTIPESDPWDDTGSIDSSLQYEDDRYREERLVLDVFDEVS